jgi:hypothetical protein
MESKGFLVLVTRSWDGGFHEQQGARGGRSVFRRVWSGDDERTC